MIRFSLAIFAAFVAAAMVRADPAPVPETHVSPAGLNFTLLPVSEADYVQISLYWPGAAALAQPGREGLFAIGPRLAFEEAGGRRFDEITEDLTDAGANALLVTTMQGTYAILQAQDSDGLVPAASVLNDVLTDAALSEDDLDWVKRTIEDGLAESERDPESLLDRILTVLLAQGDRRASALTSRPFETVSAVTVDDVRGWIAASFDATPLAVVSGSLTPQEAGAAIDMALANLAGRPDPAVPAPLDLQADAVTAVIDAPEAETALVAVAFPASPTDRALTVALDALAGGDDARLFSRLRETDNATYGVNLSYTPLTADLMSVALIASVPPERAQATLIAVREEIAAIRAGGVTEAELGGARERTAAQEEEYLRDPGSLVGLVIDQVVRGTEIDPEALREADDMVDLKKINDSIPSSLPPNAVGVIVTPRPDLATGDCTGRTPETLAGCVAHAD